MDFSIPVKQSKFHNIQLTELIDKNRIKELLECELREEYVDENGYKVNEYKQLSKLYSKIKGNKLPVKYQHSKNGKDVGRIANQFRVVKDQTLHQRTTQVGSVPAWMPCFDGCYNQLHFIVHGLNHVSTETKR